MRLRGEDSAQCFSWDEERADSIWLVTGAASGLGRELAQSALRHGHRVVATAEHFEDLWPLVAEHQSAVIPIEVDVNDESADRDTVERVIRMVERVDVVVNNAGYDRVALNETAQAIYERVQTNLFGALWVSQTAVSYMRSAGGGRIILVFGPDVPAPLDLAHLDGARRALDHFAERLAQEVAADHIEVTVCVPEAGYAEWLATCGPRQYRVSPVLHTWN